MTRPSTWSVRFAVSGIIATIVIPLSAAYTTEGDEKAELLASKGLTLVKKQYRLLDDEDGVYSVYQTALGKLAKANQAIAEAGELVARNEAIVGYRQRIAFHQAFGDEMQQAMSDGMTRDEQEGARGARKEVRLAKKERAKQGLARANLRPNEQKQLIAAAEDACKEADSARKELFDRVSELAAKYRQLRMDKEVLAAAEPSKVGPSGGFTQLARSFNIATEPPKDGAAKVKRVPGQLPANVTAAVQELTSAAETLRSVAFNKNGDQYESKNKRRNDTVEPIEKAIAKLNRGESVPKLIEEASDLNRGYSNRNRMLPQVRRSIDAAGEHLTKALSHLSEK